MEFVNERLVLKSASELFSLGKFLGSYGVLSLLSEVKDNTTVLVKSHRPLSEKVILSLNSKEKNLASAPLYEIELSDSLRSIVVGIFLQHVERKLKQIEFSFIEKTFANKNFPLQNVIKASFKNDFFFVYVLLSLFQKEPNNEHLIEVSLYCLALLLEADEDSDITCWTTMFQAGFLHDIGMKNRRSQWQELDNFHLNDVHDRIGIRDISDKELLDKIKDIILGHNSLENNYSDKPSIKDLKKEKNKLFKAILNLVEFYFYLRNKYKISAKDTGIDNENKESKIFYKIGYHCAKGAFSQELVGIMESHYHRYLSVFTYAKQIGKIENSCRYKNLALAYPKPKVSQVLCLDNSVVCPYMLTTQPINIVNTDKENLLLGTSIKKGWYNKCELESYIPAPPDEL